MYVLCERLRYECLNGDSSKGGHREDNIYRAYPYLLLGSRDNQIGGCFSGTLRNTGETNEYTTIATAIEAKYLKAIRKRAFRKRNVVCSCGVSGVYACVGRRERLQDSVLLWTGQEQEQVLAHLHPRHPRVWRLWGPNNYRAFICSACSRETQILPVARNRS